MAVGDLVGDLATAYLTPAQRAAQANGAQSITGGPIARASGQLPAATGLAALAPVVAAQPVASALPAQPAGLASLSPAQVPANPTSAPAAATATAQPASLASLSPATAPAAVALSQSSTAQPALAQAPASLENAFQATGIGTGSNAIVTRTGVGGVPEFSNRSADLASAAGLQPTAIAAQLPNSLSQLSPGAGRSPDPQASLGSLGSASNLGDGIGTFSQAQAGDSALAMSRFQKANDLRQAYRDQDRLDAALAANTRANNTTIVRDSSRPITRADIYRDQQDQAAAQGRLDNITTAQNAINGRQQARGTEQALQRNARLEDILAAGQAPGATPEQQAAAQRVLDPTGKNAFARQQAQAQLTNTELEGQLKQQDLTQKVQAQQQSVQDRAQAQAGQAATFDQALGSIDTLLGTKVDPKNPNGPRLDEDPGLTKTLGPVDGLIPNAPGTKGADFEARLDTLKAQTFLPQVAALRGTGALSDAEGKKLSDSVGALSTKMSEDAFRKSLAEVRATLQAAKERSIKPGQSQASASASRNTNTAQTAGALPTVTTKAQADALPAGSLFIGPDGRQYRK